MQGLMQDYPLALPHIFHRAERMFPGREIVTATAAGKERTTYGRWAERTRRLGGALDTLGVSADGRVATFGWNTARHLELYFAAPCSGRVLHTLAVRMTDALGVSESDVILPVVPMFHANVWGLGHAAPFAGASLIMPGPDLSPGAVADLLESEKVTIAAGVPTIWMGVLPELEGRDLSSLRKIICGGSAVPRSLSEAYREKTGLPITQAWGMTETSPIASVGVIKSTVADKTEDELADLRASQGLVAPGVDLRIADPESGEEAPWDGKTSGELQVRGPWIAADYYNDPRSRESFTD